MRCHSVEISEALAQHVLEQMMCLHVREYKSLIRAQHGLFWSSSCCQQFWNKFYCDNSGCSSYGHTNVGALRRARWSRWMCDNVSISMWEENMTYADRLVDVSALHDVRMATSVWVHACRIRQQFHMCVGSSRGYVLAKSSYMYARRRFLMRDECEQTIV